MLVELNIELFATLYEDCELIIDCESSTWHGCLYFPRFIPEFNGATLSVMGDVPVDSEASVVTS